MSTQSRSKDYITREDLDKFGEKQHRLIVDDLSQVIADFALQADKRFNQLEARMDKLELQFERLNNTLDAFLKRLDDMEKDNLARDAQLARLERWIEQVAKKTGTKLEY